MVPECYKVDMLLKGYSLGFLRVNSLKCMQPDIDILISSLYDVINTLFVL